MDCDTNDNLKNNFKDAVDSLRKAVDAIADRALGKDTTGHLRQAARHGLKAVKAMVEKAEQRLDEQIAGSGKDGTPH